MLSYDDRHYRFCHTCRKWWYWGKGECHNSDCKRYVAPQERLRESPQFCALEATQPPWHRISLHDFVFSLEDRGGSCRAKKDVIVLTSVTKTDLHERHDPPLKGKRIELAVRAKGDTLASRGADSVDVVANCHNWISDNWLAVEASKLNTMGETSTCSTQCLLVTQKNSSAPL